MHSHDGGPRHTRAGSVRLPPATLRLAVACAALLATALHATSVRAEWDYRHGFGFSSRGNEVRLNVFVRPRYEYLSDAGSGSARSSFVLDLVEIGRAHV